MTSGTFHGGYRSGKEAARGGSQWSGFRRQPTATLDGKSARLFEKGRYEGESGFNDNQSRNSTVLEKDQTKIDP
jgi:hypothetical protein